MLGPGLLEIHEPVLHLFRLGLQNLPNFCQTLDDAAETAIALTATNDTGVWNAGFFAKERLSAFRIALRTRLEYEKLAERHKF